jgi:hypothetical protein
MYIHLSPFHLARMQEKLQYKKGNKTFTIMAYMKHLETTVTNQYCVQEKYNKFGAYLLPFRLYFIYWSLI